jgi:hypothetical protein
MTLDRYDYYTDRRLEREVAEIHVRNVISAMVADFRDNIESQLRAVGVDIR